MRDPLLRDPGVVASRSVLRIGAIAFDATSQLPFQDTPHSTYDEFLTGEPEPGDARVAVALEQGDPAPGPEGRRTFDTGSAWAAYEYPDGERAIVMALPASRHVPLLQARFDREVTRVRVVCSTGLAVNGRFYNPLRYPLDQLLVMQRLAREGGAIVHCALVDVDGLAVVCPGVSGAGKTTLARQLIGLPGLRVLSDDRAVIRRVGDGYRAYGTPWPGEGGFALNASLPLAAIGFIQQAALPRTEPISRSQAIHRMVRVTSIPWYDREAGPRVFDGLTELCGRVPTFLLGVPADAAAATAVRALAGGLLLESNRRP